MRYEEFVEQRRRDHFARPIEKPADIPALAIVPGQFRSETLRASVDDLIDNPARAAMDALHDKVKAEDERVRRMLPPAPPGMEWRGELQSSDQIDYQTLRAEVAVRLRYRLFDLRTGEDVFDRWARIAEAE